MSLGQHLFPKPAKELLRCEPGHLDPRLERLMILFLYDNRHTIPVLSIFLVYKVMQDFYHQPNDGRRRALGFSTWKFGAICEPRSKLLVRGFYRRNTYIYI